MQLVYQDPDSQGNKGNYKGNNKGDFELIQLWFACLLVCLFVYFQLELAKTNPFCLAAKKLKFYTN